MGASTFMWVHRVFSGCIEVAVGASFLSWVHHPFNACIGLVVGVLVLSWVQWSCRPGIIVIGALVISASVFCDNLLLWFSCLAVAISILTLFVLFLFEQLDS